MTVDKPPDAIDNTAQGLFIAHIMGMISAEMAPTKLRRNADFILYLKMAAMKISSSKNLKAGSEISSVSWCISIWAVLNQCVGQVGHLAPFL